MSTQSAVKTILEADATLLAAATGGIWDFGETGHKGINRTVTPTAFDEVGRIKPCVLIRLRSETPAGGLNDDPAQYVSVRQIVELWFYQDSGYTTIETLRNRCYTLLHGRQLAGTFVVTWAGDVRGQRDLELDASVERSDYQGIVKRSSS